MTEVVNITMYGGKGLFGGREVKKSAIISSCELASSCPANQAGRCAAANPNFQSCQYLKNERIEGYTSRSSKYYEFVSQWTSHEKYNCVRKLKRFEYIGNNKVRINLPHIDIKKAVEGEPNGYDSIPIKNPQYLDKSDLTVDSIKLIMESYSTSMFGSKLDCAEEKSEMLIDIKEVDKELYDQYVEQTKCEINYVGKLAYLNTIKPNVSFPSGWIWDGEYMRKQSLDKVYCEVINGFSNGTEISFKPEEDALVKIEDNSWVEENTKFKF